jgi:flagellar motor component MotA
MMRFLFGSLGALCVILLCILMEGSNPLSFLMLTPGLIALFVPAFAVFAAYPLREWGEAWKDSLGREGPGRSSERSREIWDFEEKASYASGVIALLVGLIIILSNLTEPSRLGPAVAVSVTGPLYATILGLLCRILRARASRAV